MPDYGPQYRIKPVEFNITPFQPAQMRFVNSDMSILQRSVAMAEQRKTQAETLADNLRKSLSEARGILHDDDETNNWIQQKSNEIQGAIDSYIARGDYGGLTSYVKQANSNFFDDPEFTARQKSNDQYKTWVEETKKQALEDGNSDALDMILNREENKYRFNSTPNEKGTFDGNWEPGRRYVKRIDITTVAGYARQLVTPQHRSSDVARSTSNSDGSSSSSQKATTTDKVSAERYKSWWNNFYRVENPDVNASMQQDYDTYNYIYNKYKNSDNERDRERANMAKQYITNDSGIPISYEEYINKFSDEVWKQLERDDITTVDHSSSGAAGSIGREGYGLQGLNPLTQIPPSVLKVLTGVQVNRALNYQVNTQGIVGDTDASIAGFNNLMSSKNFDSSPAQSTRVWGLDINFSGGK